MTEKKRDYAADLEIAETLKTDYWQAVEVEAIAFDELACNSLEWYIRKVMELEAQLSEAQAREAGLREVLKNIREYAQKREFIVSMYPILDACEDALSSPSPAADRIKDIQDYGTPETWRKDGSDKAKWVRYYKESGRSCNNCAFDTGRMSCSCWGDKFVPRDGLVSLEKEGIPQLCEDQRGNKCTVRESLCGITGDNTCCLTCGKAKNCEDPCEYALEKAGGEK